MSFISKIFGGGKAEKRDAGLSNLSQLAWSLFGNTSITASGEAVNETVALQHATVYTCTRIIAESVGSLTLRLYSRQGKGRNEEYSNPLHRIFAIEPNSEMSAPVCWETVAGSMALCGNAYLQILRNAGGEAVGIYPLDARRTEPVRLPNKQLAFRTYADGVTTGRIIAAEDMLHFPLFSLDGLRGLSPISQAANTIGMARATEKFGSHFFGNGSRPSGLLTPVKEVGEEDLTNMRVFWEQANSADNQGRICALPSDWKYTQLTISPNDSQFLETQGFTRTMIASLFRLPPSMLGDTARLAVANHEQQSLSLVTDTLRPYLVRIEKEIARKLLPRDGSMFVEFDVSERLRGDFQSTMQGFAVGKQWGIFTTNYCLEALGENPIGPAGDVRWAPYNMQNAENLVQVTTPDAPAEVKSKLTGYLPALNGLVTDAIGRTTKRSKRDAETIEPLFTPIIESVLAIAVDEARAKFDLPESWSPSDKVKREAIKSIALRSASWTEESKIAASVAEVDKIVRSIALNTYREAGAEVALSELKEATHA